MTFKAWEMPSQVRGAKMKKDEISIIFSEGKNMSLTFNQDVTQEIKEKGFRAVCIYQDDVTSEINLVIGKTGLMLSRTGKETENFNYKLSSKSWVKRLCYELNLSTDGRKHCVQITSNLSKTEECLSYRILKVKY